MPITVLNDIIIDCSIVSAGVRGKQMRNNTRSMLFNGYAQINVNWTKTLRQYEIGIVPMLREQWQYIEALHEATQGGAYGMLMVDPKDSEVTFAGNDGMVNGWFQNALSGNGGVGAGIPTYKLAKRYLVTGTSRYTDRYITRPKSAVSVKLGGSTLTPGTGSGQYSVNYDTGDLTVVHSSSASISSFTAGATTTLTFSSGTFPALFTTGGRMWVETASGTAASTLLQKPLPIASVSGNNVVLSVNTTGLTLSSATCRRYPQPNQSFVWDGEFYVPVHFLDDSIDWELARGGNYDDRLVAGPSCVLIEVRE